MNLFQIPNFELKLNFGERDLVSIAYIILESQTELEVAYHLLFEFMSLGFW